MRIILFGILAALLVAEIVSSTISGWRYYKNKNTPEVITEVIKAVALLILLIILLSSESFKNAAAGVSLLVLMANWIQTC